MIGRIYLLLGSNMGDRFVEINKALQLIRLEFIEILKTSSFYETSAWGIENQPNFINAAVEVATEKTPAELILTLQKIEDELGKEKEVKWGPRNIDIDILYFRQVIQESKELVLPHPETQNRRFALVPMCELNEDFIHPVFSVSQKKLLDDCPDKGEVKKLNEYPKF